MAGKRLMRSGRFKVQVARAVLQGSPVSRRASRFGVAPGQIAAWKKRLVEGAPELFADRRVKRGSGVQEKVLYEPIGRLRMELAWLKKSCLERAA